MRRSVHAFAVLAVLGASCTGGQTGDEGVRGEGACPPPLDWAGIRIACVPSELPTVKTTGPCTVNSADEGPSTYVLLRGTDAGTCHVELTFANGATSSTDLKFMSRWRPLGSDPHGCGREFVPVDESGNFCVPHACLFPLPDRMCEDAGTANDPAE